MPSSRFRYRLPLPNNPIATDLVCYEVQLPNEPKILEAFEGAVLMLSNWTYWALDQQHTAIIASNVFKQLYDRLQAQKCSVPPAFGADEGVEQLIRQNPTNPCLLETSIDGTNWCVFADLSKCFQNPVQPGAGTPQPPPNGGNACYNAYLPASGVWLLPTNVNTGDVLTITGLTGAGWDGGADVWRCPNGQPFFFGACIGAGILVSGDPIPTHSHMTVIAKIGSNYYPADTGTITVPSGVSNAQVSFQINDSNIGIAQGSYTFSVCVQNNQAGTWEKVFDFTQTDGGFVSDAGTGGATYIPGTGWQSNNAGSNSMGFKRTSVPTYTLTSAELHMLLDTPQAGANLYVDNGTSGLPATPYTGTGVQTYFTSGNVTISNGVLRFGADGTADSLGRHQTYQRVVLRGTGVNPFPAS